MRRSRVAGLARRVHRPTIVPIADIDDPPAAQAAGATPEAVSPWPDAVLPLA